MSSSQPSPLRDTTGSETPGPPSHLAWIEYGSTAVALAVLVADCTPVLLVDRKAGVVGAAHAGRPGMQARVGPAAVEALLRASAVMVMTATS